MRNKALILGILYWVGCFGVTSAQDTSVDVMVRDIVGKPVPEAQVRMVRDGELYREALTDANGKVSFDRVITPNEYQPNIQETNFDAHTYPNPVTKGYTFYDFSLDEQMHVQLALFDVLGRKVMVHDEMLGAGEHKVRLDMGGVASGIYLLNIHTGAESETVTMAYLEGGSGTTEISVQDGGASEKERAKAAGVTYDVIVTKEDYYSDTTTVTISEDVSLDVELMKQVSATITLRNAVTGEKTNGYALMDDDSLATDGTFTLDFGRDLEKKVTFASLEDGKTISYYAHHTLENTGKDTTLNIGLIEYKIYDENNEFVANLSDSPIATEQDSAEMTIDQFFEFANVHYEGRLDGGRDAPHRDDKLQVPVGGSWDELIIAKNLVSSFSGNLSSSYSQQDIDIINDVFENQMKKISPNLKISYVDTVTTDYVDSFEYTNKLLLSPGTPVGAGYFAIEFYNNHPSISDGTPKAGLAGVLTVEEQIDKFGSFDEDFYRHVLIAELGQLLYLTSNSELSGRNQGEEGFNGNCYTALGDDAQACQPLFDESPANSVLDYGIVFGENFLITAFTPYDFTMAKVLSSTKEFGEIVLDEPLFYHNQSRDEMMSLERTVDPQKYVTRTQTDF